MKLSDRLTQSTPPTPSKPATRGGSSAKSPASGSSGGGSGGKGAAAGSSSRGTSGKGSGRGSSSKGSGKGSGNGASRKGSSGKGSSGKGSSAKSSSNGAGRGGANSKRSGDGRSSRRAVHELVLAELAPKLSGPDALTGDDLEAEVKATVDRISQREDVEVSPLERRQFISDLLSDILGYGALDPLLADASVTEIMCNAHDQIWVERDGRMQLTDVAFEDESHYRQVIERIVSQVGRRVDEGSPMVDARLPDGSRVNAIIPPLAVRGPCLTIRKFPEEAFTVNDLVGFGTLSLDLAVFLEACVEARLNVLVSGGTATGKTTLLNVLSAFIPDGDRIITIEDAAELRLQQPHVVTLEARPANAEGEGQVVIRDLVRNALRMRPDRIVVGEARGAEALDMLQAMNTGHEGSLTTIHANGPRDALSRLETLVLMAGYDLPVRAIREQITAAIDVIVQLDRSADGGRIVTSVQEVQGLEDATVTLQELFTCRTQSSSDGRDTSSIEPTGLRPKLIERIQAAGVELPMHIFQPGARRKAETGGSSDAESPAPGRSSRKG